MQIVSATPGQIAISQKNFKDLNFYSILSFEPIVNI